MAKIVIDLSAWKAPLEEFLRDEISKFKKENPKVKLSALGIYYAGLNPGLTLTLETKAHSDAAIKSGGSAKDKHGKFHAEPYEFEYNANEFQFKKFPDMYKMPRQFSVKQIDGKVDDVDSEEDGDDGMNKVMLTFLVSVLQPFDRFQELNREKPFRVIIVMHNSDSNLSKNWVVA